MTARARWTVAFALALGLGGGARAADDEQRLRAAFVLRFAQYTQWAELPAGASLQLCAVGSSSTSRRPDLQKSWGFTH